MDIMRAIAVLDAPAIFKNTQIEVTPKVPREIIREYRSGNVSEKDLFTAAFLNNIAYNKGREGLERYGDLMGFAIKTTVKKTTEKAAEAVVTEIVERTTGEVIGSVPVPIEIISDLATGKYTEDEGGERFFADAVKFIIEAGAPPTTAVFLAWEAAPAVVEAATGHNITYHKSEQPHSQGYADLLKKRYFMMHHVNESFMKVEPTVANNPEAFNAMLDIAEARGYAGIFVAETEEESLWPANVPPIHYTNITFYDVDGRNATWSDKPEGSMWHENRPPPDLSSRVNESEIKIGERDPMEWTITYGHLTSTGDVGAYSIVDDPNDNTYLSALLEAEKKGEITREQAEDLIALYTGVDLPENKTEELGKALDVGEVSNES